ncbi:hypothetical protein SESBI_28910 [Sesbania bispinosa]|nr:hypothetical protein SESBI_28910 [Sesbania bispinosa]
MTTLNDDINRQIREVLAEIKKLPEWLPLELDRALVVFCSWYDSFTLTLNRINENEVLQENVQKEEEALRVQLLEKNSKFQTSSESILKGESRVEALGKKIEDLKRQLASKTEEYTLLTSAFPKCREQQEKLKVGLKDESAKLLSYLRDVDKARRSRRYSTRGFLQSDEPKAPIFKTIFSSLERGGLVSIKLSNYSGLTLYPDAS